ncbi:hypothetical protein JAAARDRAFT_192565 [Jaapia argillacea MUCL 33604]|uniref:Arrestin-like N-terminal domain-containing protein n=1 Tax=Jaapia argillacea MUCL 33604 TaxID=933084 RepID=A0A067Q8U0_9AGAM|nr:hypothetical protein JAAARDRAFT_192565 [Jaapia argillacea MUCL 33604]
MVHTRPEPMNASPHHSKVKVSLTLSDPLFQAGDAVSGKLELECRADKGLGLGVMMVELFGIEELTSRDHSATSTFLHSRRRFQGEGLPPSNAVLAHPYPGEPPLPAHYHPARRGQTTFLFRIPLPFSCPSSLNFGSGLARLRYEVRATVGVAWKGEKRLVTDRKEVEVVEGFEDDPVRVAPEAVVVGEHGKIWVQGRVAGGVVVAGRSACVELQVKNHSTKKNSGLSITLTRHLHLPKIPNEEKPPLQISDTLTTVAFRGPEYIAQPGTEGIASLVFEVPKNAIGVKGGLREDEPESDRISEALFEVRCTICVKMSMGIGNKDILLELPVTIYHPSTLPSLPDGDPYPDPYALPYDYSLLDPPPQPTRSPAPLMDPIHNPYGYPPLPMSPPLNPYYEQTPMWFPPPPSQTPLPYAYMSPPLPGHHQPYYFPPPVMSPPPFAMPPRPSSAEPFPSHSHPINSFLPSGLPVTSTQPPPLIPLHSNANSHRYQNMPVEPEEGKGERASRISHHLRLTSRHRSVSPQSHRFPLPPPASSTQAPAPPQPQPSLAPIPAHHSSTQNPNRLTAMSTSPTEIMCPRPMPSPKHTVTIDPFTQLSLTKSDRVGYLEAMAAEVDQWNTDMSGDIPREPITTKQGEVANMDKTLPGPPVPSGKGVFGALAASRRRRVDEVFSALSPPLSAEQTPPTPTLTALCPGRGTRNGPLVMNSKNESGLDILERRLLAEVGTRKVDKDDKKVDVREVLGMSMGMAIPIPSKKTQSDGLDNLNDSAISSLTLPGVDGDGDGLDGLGADVGSVDERTTQRSRSRTRSRVEDDGLEEMRKEMSRRRDSLDVFDLEGDPGRERGRRSEERRKSAEKARASEEIARKEEENTRKSGEKARKSEEKARRSEEKTRKSEEKIRRSEEKERRSGGKQKAGRNGKDVEAFRLRKAAKGRVAEWLGRIDPDVPPPTVHTPPPTTPDIGHGDAPMEAQQQLEALRQDVLAEEQMESRKSPLHQLAFSHNDVSPEEQPPAHTAQQDVDAAPNPRSSGFMPIATFRASRIRQTPRNVEQRSAPPNHEIPASPSTESKPIDKDADKAKATSPSQSVNKTPVLKSPPKLPVQWPPPLDSHVKYDVRSARGGRGGKVASVTAIWASAGPSNDVLERQLAKAEALKPVKQGSPGVKPPIPPKPKSLDVLPPRRMTSPLVQPSQEPKTKIGSPLRFDAPPPKPPKPSHSRSPAVTSPSPELPSLADLTARRAKMIKSVSVPAMVSSSLAKPTLSSTASLVKPPMSGKTRSPIKVPPTVLESTMQSDAVGVTKIPGDLAFGQARLRDLIKKYQGQGT